MSGDLLSDTGASLATGTGSGTKFIKLDVPDFSAAGGTQTTYLRLGANEVSNPIASPQAGDPNGEDLAARVTSFYDDEQDRDGGQTKAISGSTAAETAALHTKGGWRDHTEGNRITTTRGDKVEVIGGNYRLVVLGRTSGTDGHIYDSSGGVEQSVDQTPYAISEVKWVTTSTTDDTGTTSNQATWMVKTEGSKGDYHSITYGFHSDDHTGDTESTHTGNATSTHTGDVTSTHTGSTMSIDTGNTITEGNYHGNVHGQDCFGARESITFGLGDVSVRMVLETFETNVNILSQAIGLGALQFDVNLYGAMSTANITAVYNDFTTGVKIDSSAARTDLTGAKKVLSALIMQG